jgi:hypothetical protein
MAVELKGRKVAMFRCHIDPMIPPKPANAFAVGQSNIEHAELTPAGVYVSTMKEKLEFLIPYANVQAIRLAVVPKDEPEEKKKAA